MSDIKNKSLEELYPGKRAEIESFTTEDQVRAEFAKLQTAYDVYTNKYSAIINARTDAMNWSDDEKKLALIVDKTLDAFSGWAISLSGLISKNHLYDLEEVIADMGIEISDVIIELRGTVLVDANDKDLALRMKKIMSGTEEYPQ
jgi:hypothetical protein